MTRDLLAQDPGSVEFLRQAEDRLHKPLGRLMAEGPEPALQATENAQPAILFHSLALLRLMASRGFAPSLVAGHSMGEFAGLVAAEALDPLDALEAVQARGRAMSAAAPAASGMIAVLGLPDSEVERVCAASEGLVVVANYNAPGQVVVSGSEAGLRAVGPQLEAAGAKRLVRLPVSGAFHSPLMVEAARVFAAAWTTIPLHELRRPQVFNADAQVHAHPDDVRRLMVGQLTGPVRWTQSIQRLQELGADRYVEVGPRRTLTGLVKKIIPGAVIHNTEDLPSMNALLETIDG
ncbi:MAG: ACP S-malonyltransferase [Chloroflexi bacterium]|nr:MAG: ACP S-malonyltransferase [Chloroflexota bacterium]TME58221.1 MAG: ACP S-malonyltransferase [Chloroflexota bacterium]